MNRNNSRTLLVKAASFLGVAGLSVLISLPGFSQQSPNNASPSVPSTVKPTNPGGQDAGTTNGGENLNRVPSSDSTIQRNNSTQPNNLGQPAGSGADNAAPTFRPDAVNRVEGRDQVSPQDRTNSAPSGTYNDNYGQPGANQPGATTGGDASQQQQNGLMQQRPQTMPRNNGQYQGSQNRMNSTPSGSYNGSYGQPGANQPGATTGGDASQQQQNGSMQQRSQTTPQNNGQYLNQQGTPKSDNSSGTSTESQSTSQPNNTNGGVRALW